MEDILNGEISDLFISLLTYPHFLIFCNEDVFLVVQRWKKTTWSIALFPQHLFEKYWKSRGNGASANTSSSGRDTTGGAHLEARLSLGWGQGVGIVCSLGRSTELSQTESARSFLGFDCVISNRSGCFCEKTHVLSFSGFIALWDCQDFNVLQEQIYRYVTQ